MADQQIGTAISNPNVVTLQITTTAPVSVGQLIVVAVQNYDAAGAAASCADDAGNVYALDKQLRSSGDVNLVGTIFSAPCTTQLNTGQKITITFSPSGTFIEAAAVKFDSADLTSSRVDTTASKNNGTALAWDTNSANTSNERDILVGACFEISGSAIDTPGGTNTELVDFNNGSDSMTVLFRRVTATGNYNVNGTWAVPGPPPADNIGLLVAYKSLALATFRSVRAFQEDGDPRAFQPQGFQRPDPIRAFQEFSLGPQAAAGSTEGFQPNAFQRPDWIQAFQDTAFDDEGFQEAADAFQDNALQGDAFQQDHLEAAAAVVTARPQGMVRRGRDSSRLVRRTQHHDRAIITRSVVSAPPGPQQPIRNPVRLHHRIARLRHDRTIIVRSVVQAQPAPQQPLRNSALHHRRIARTRHDRPQIVRNPVVTPIVVAPPRPALLRAQSGRSRLVAVHRHHRPVVVRAPSVTTPTPLVKPTVVRVAQNRSRVVAAHRHHRPQLVRAPQPFVVAATPKLSIIRVSQTRSRVVAAHRHHRPLIVRAPMAEVRRRIVVRVTRRANLVAHRHHHALVLRAPQTTKLVKPVVVRSSRSRVVAAHRHHRALIAKPSSLVIVATTPPTRPPVVREQRIRLTALHRHHRPQIVKAPYYATPTPLVKPVVVRTSQTRSRIVTLHRHHHPILQRAPQPVFVASTRVATALVTRRARTVAAHRHHRPVIVRAPQTPIRVRLVVSRPQRLSRTLAFRRHHRPLIQRGPLSPPSFTRPTIVVAHRARQAYVVRRAHHRVKTYRAPTFTTATPLQRGRIVVRPDAIRTRLVFRRLRQQPLVLHPPAPPLITVFASRGKMALSDSVAGDLGLSDKAAITLVLSDQSTGELALSDTATVEFVLSDQVVGDMRLGDQLGD